MMCGILLSCSDLNVISHLPWLEFKHLETQCNWPETRTDNFYAYRRSWLAIKEVLSVKCCRQPACCCECGCSARALFVFSILLIFHYIGAFLTKWQRQFCWDFDASNTLEFGYVPPSWFPTFAYKSSKKTPTDPWNIPRTLNHLFMKEVLSYSYFGVSRVCSRYLIYIII